MPMAREKCSPHRENGPASKGNRLYRIIKGILRSNQQHAHWDESSLEGVEHESEALQCRRAQQGLVSFFAKNHGRGATLASKFEVGVAHSASERRPIRQRKVYLSMRSNSQLLKRRGRDQAIERTRINKEFDGRFAPGAVALFHEQLLVCQTHSKGRL